MRRPATLVKAVVFDFGYTLINEDRVWGAIAAQHGWPMSVFFATLGTVIERRGHHRDVFELLGAAKPYEPVAFEPRDFYKDALPSVRALKGRGCVVGIAGNMRAEIERFLSRHVDVDFIASSERWGVEKPDPDFFARIVAAAKAPPEDIVYVGDRIDNDVVPAAQAGMLAVHIQRGPWAAIQQSWPEARTAAMTISNLDSIAS
jgi:FMN phosphatase YigB (HAD superfamily)